MQLRTMVMMMRQRYLETNFEEEGAFSRLLSWVIKDVIVASRLLLLLPMGAAAVLFVSTTNAMLQLNAAPAMRGRVMALWAMLFLGSTPIGAPIAGLLASAVGARWAVALGGLATLAAGVGGAWALRRRHLEEGTCEVPWCLPETEEAGAVAGSAPVR